MPVRAGGPDGSGAAQFGTQPALEMTDQIVVRYLARHATGSAEEANARSRVAQSVRLQGLAARFRRETGGGSAVWKLERPVPVAQAQEIARQLQAADREVEFAHADTLLQAAYVPNDPYYGSMWSYADNAAGISLPLAWDISSGAGVTVAVIDTGFRPHADLAGKVVGGYDFIANVGTANDGNGRDGDAQDPGDWGSCRASSSWHGTHVAGNIGALAGNGMGSLGVAFNASIVSARVLGVCGGYTSDIADAIRWTSGNAVTGVPANPHPARVLNLSLGGSGGCPSEMSSAVGAARSLGALVVVAAGNSATDAANFQPANCPGVLTVAATDSAGARASFSNFGSVVGIAAPGVSIWSTLNAGATTPGADNYASYSGTSMATPHVAGVAALVAAANPQLGGDDIAAMLKSTAKAFPGSCAGCGSGIVNAKAAVDAAVASRYRLAATPASLSIAGRGGLIYFRTVTVQNVGVAALGPVSTSIARVSGTVEVLQFGSNACSGVTLAPGASCRVQVIMAAGCGSRATSSRWNINVNAAGASSTLVVPVSGSSASGICY